MGWAEIRHPFHPLRGQRFAVLKQRRVAGADTLLLRDAARGSFAILREWTDWADPTADEHCTRLSVEALLELAILVDDLTQRGSGKQL